ncbi:MAG: hypothetical protein P8I27_00935 [Pirellulaceae bacterium]|nr:hypothetical protein [Pirellulaceae bacterium]
MRNSPGIRRVSPAAEATAGLGYQQQQPRRAKLEDLKQPYFVKSSAKNDYLSPSKNVIKRIQPRSGGTSSLAGKSSSNQVVYKRQAAQQRSKRGAKSSKKKTPREVRELVKGFHEAAEEAGDKATRAEEAGNTDEANMQWDVADLMNDRANRHADEYQTLTGTVMDGNGTPRPEQIVYKDGVTRWSYKDTLLSQGIDPSDMTREQQVEAADRIEHRQQETAKQQAAEVADQYVRDTLDVRPDVWEQLTDTEKGELVDANDQKFIKDFVDQHEIPELGEGHLPEVYEQRDQLIDLQGSDVRTSVPGALNDKYPDLLTPGDKGNPGAGEPDDDTSRGGSGGDNGGIDVGDDVGIDVGDDAEDNVEDNVEDDVEDDDWGDWDDVDVEGDWEDVDDETSQGGGTTGGTYTIVETSDGGYDLNIYDENGQLLGTEHFTPNEDGSFTGDLGGFHPEGADLDSFESNDGSWSGENGSWTAEGTDEDGPSDNGNGSGSGTGGDDDEDSDDEDSDDEDSDDEDSDDEDSDDEDSDDEDSDDEDSDDEDSDDEDSDDDDSGDSDDGESSDEEETEEEESENYAEPTGDPDGQAPPDHVGMREFIEEHRQHDEEADRNSEINPDRNGDGGGEVPVWLQDRLPQLGKRPGSPGPDPVVDPGGELPRQQEISWLDMIMADLANQGTIDYGPDGKPNTPAVGPIPAPPIAAGSDQSVTDGDTGQSGDNQQASGDDEN